MATVHDLPQFPLFIGSIRDRLSIITLNGNEYADALQASAALGIVGGGIYDGGRHLPFAPRVW